MRCVSGFGALALLASAPVAQAAQYTSEAAFVATLNPGYYHEPFSGYPNFSGHATPMNFAGGAGYSYQASTGAQAFLVFDIGGNKYLTTSGTPTFQWSSPVTITFTGAPVTAIGGSFFMTTASGGLAGSDVSLGFSDGTNVVLNGQANSSFFGYTSANPVTSLTITPPATHQFVSIDNLYVGSIPAPGVVGAIAFGGVLAARRRR